MVRLLKIIKFKMRDWTLELNCSQATVLNDFQRQCVQRKLWLFKQSNSNLTRINQEEGRMIIS